MRVAESSSRRLFCFTCLCYRGHFRQSTCIRYVCFAMGVFECIVPVLRKLFLLSVRHCSWRITWLIDWWLMNWPRVHFIWFGSHCRQLELWIVYVVFVPANSMSCCCLCDLVLNLLWRSLLRNRATSWQRTLTSWRHQVGNMIIVALSVIGLQQRRFTYLHIGFRLVDMSFRRELNA